MGDRLRRVNASSPESDSPAERDAGALETVRAIALRHASRPGALLPILHAVQDALGHIPKGCVPEIAEALNLSRAEVHGVVSYYSHFRSEPLGEIVLQVCLAEACLARGARGLADQAERITGCGMNQTRSDRAVTIESVYCLGLCANGPSILLDGRPHARVSAERLQALLARSIDRLTQPRRDFRVGERP